MTELSPNQAKIVEAEASRIGTITFNDVTCSAIKEAYRLQERYLHPRGVELVGDYFGTVEIAREAAQTIALFLGEQFTNAEDLDVFALSRQRGGFFILVHAEPTIDSQKIDVALDEFIAKFTVAAIKSTKK